jgi:endonuclease/exonuclease/phosphatase (EEP) superfamily protein YafD
MATLLGWCVRYGFDSLFIALCVASVLGYYGQAFWALDVWAAFRLPLLVVFAVYAVLYGLRGAWRYTQICLLILAFLAAQCVFYYPPFSAVKVAAPKPANTLRIVQINLWKKNKTPQLALTRLEQANPDVVGLEEYDAHLDAAMSATLLKHWPYRIVRPVEEMALYSRYPLTNQRVWFTQHDHVLSHPNTDTTLVAEVNVHGQPIDVALLHPLSPTRGHRYYHQRFHLGMMAERSQDLAPNTLVLGDMNATPWTWTLTHMSHELGLKDSQDGVGLMASWPVWLPMLPIDHVLYRGKALQLVHRQLLPATGSDHLPVLAVFNVVNSAN